MSVLLASEIEFLPLKLWRPSVEGIGPPATLPDPAQQKSIDGWENRGFRGLLLKLRVTNASGSPATISAVTIQARVGSTWVDWAKWSALTINTAGTYLFLLYPSASMATPALSGGVAGINPPLPYHFRPQLTQSDLNLTYQLTGDLLV